jgi:integrase
MLKGKVELTDSNVAKLKAKATKYAIWDKLCPGFGVEVTPAGSKLLVGKTCTTVGVRQVRNWFTLGTWPMLKVADARLQAYNLKDQVKKGEDPKAVIRARKAAVTVSELIDRFITDHIGAKVTWEGTTYKVELIRDGSGKPTGNKESTAREHIRLLFRDIKPVLGDYSAKDVGSGDVAALLFKIRKDRPILANRVRSVLSKLFVKAELWELRPAGSNPCKGQDRAPEHKKERNLSDQELLALGSGLRAADESRRKQEAKEALEEGDPRAEEVFALAALRLALLTGMRKGEIIGDRYRGIPSLQWADVDLEAGILHVHHKTETKTGKKRVVYLCGAAKSLQETLPRRLGNPNVIPGEVAGQALVNLQVTWDRIRAAVTATAKKEAKKAGRKAPALNLEDVTIHDLRRTFASVGARMGYPELWIAGLLGHSAATVTAGYARVNADPLRTAVEAIGGRIAGLLDGTIDPAKEAEEAKKEVKVQA